ncbi:MAG: type 11 methyltransferase [Parcubacteria group bacterium Gr01-1014_30]|nr:MAG: type 11 methyltransferase [Parcubacteria group bacterium Gr01-1014_30]
MEERKQKEIEYYDKKVGDFQRFKPSFLSSYKFLYQLLKNRCRDKVVLDFGCGAGLHSVQLAKMGAKKVIGIDLSEASLKAARLRHEMQDTKHNIQFINMDCENLDFADSYFDVIFDGGTFSSIDLETTWPELIRVLKPDGVLIGIETFGHNPLTNLKRKFNKLTGNRTAWAAKHIFRMPDLAKAKVYFGSTEAYYFHLVSWLAFPFLRLPGGKLLLKILELTDRILLELPFLRKYSFKVVFIFSEPKKSNK